MAKFVLAVAAIVVAVLCVEANRIDMAPARKIGKYFASSDIPLTKKNDPRCRKDGWFVNPNDCTKYFVCRNGESQDRTCPEGFKADSRKHCTPDENPDCGKTVLQYSTEQPIECPDEYGYFPHPDCHKFIVCVQGIPWVRSCPPHQVYDDNVGCVPGDVCPKKSEASSCTKANGQEPDLRDCRRYYQCTSGVAERKACSSGQAFDPATLTCTREHYRTCVNNALVDVMRPDEE